MAFISERTELVSHTVLVCSGRRRVASTVLGHPSIRKLSVITEEGHPDIYGTGIRVETVDDIDDPSAVLRAAMRLNRKQPIDNILTPYETGLPSGAFVRSTLGLSGMDFHTATGFTNKFVMKRRLQAAGVNVMPNLLAQDREHLLERAESLGYPVVLKPVYGGGSIGVAVCDDAAEAHDWWNSHATGRSHPVALVEKKAELKAEYHFDAIVRDSKTRFSVASRYGEPMLVNVVQRLPYASYQLPPDHPDSVMIESLHDHTISALGLQSGVTHMEVFRTDDGWFVSEIACRAAGGAIPEAIALHHGIDLFDTAIRLSLAESVDFAVPAAESRHPFFGHAALSVKAGKITAVAAASTFEDVPGVVAVDIRSKVGEVIPESFYSTVASGYVYVGADSEAAMREALTEIRRRQVVDTTTP